MTFEVALALIMAQASGLSIETEDLICLSQNVYHEARSEDYQGQLAVAYVTLNRVGKKDFSDSICEVVYAQSQFSWTNDGLSDHTEDRHAFVKAMRASIDAIRGSSPDPTLGATYFYNFNKVKPGWARAFTTSATIGSHRFLRSEG